MSEPKRMTDERLAEIRHYAVNTLLDKSDSPICDLLEEVGSLTAERDKWKATAEKHYLAGIDTGVVIGEQNAVANEDVMGLNVILKAKNDALAKQLDTAESDLGSARDEIARLTAERDEARQALQDCVDSFQKRDNLSDRQRVIDRALIALSNPE